MIEEKYRYVEHLSDMEFIAGDTVTLAYKWFDGDAKQIINPNMQFTLFSYDDWEHSVITKTVSANQISIDNGIAYVTLDSTETDALYGKYVQQPMLNYDSYKFKRAYGYIIFRREAT